MTSAGTLAKAVPTSVIDPNIDVHAQYALLRMARGGPFGKADVAQVLDAVRSRALAGIFKEDERVPAVRAQQLGLGGWQLVPPGQDAGAFPTPIGRSTPANDNQEALCLAPVNLGGDIGCVLRYRDALVRAMTAMREALDAGWLIHVAVVSGYGPGTGCRTNICTSQGLALNDHSILIIGYDATPTGELEKFVFWDPHGRASRATIHGQAFGFLHVDRRAPRPVGDHQACQQRPRGRRRDDRGLVIRPRGFEGIGTQLLGVEHRAPVRTTMLPSAVADGKHDQRDAYLSSMWPRADRSADWT